MPKAPTVDELGEEDLVTATMHSFGRDPLTGTFLRPGDTVQLPKSVGEDLLRRGHLRKATKDEKEALLAEPETPDIEGEESEEDAQKEDAAAAGLPPPADSGDDEGDAGTSGGAPPVASPTGTAAPPSSGGVASGGTARK